jgi:BirA family transcriptional regulator, biotin operon repressor / biotin---[acetyl-CoA-carboxylase] ligase
LADDFDRTRFATRLRTQRLGRTLHVLERTDSTNDDAWDALAGSGGPSGARDGVAVVALVQTRGRGRAGRGWSQVPGRGLALSVALRLGGDVRQAGAIPLAAGLAVARTAHALGVHGARLKWPNDVLVNGRKLAGVLCEVRGTHAKDRSAAHPGDASGGAVVIGVGLNVLNDRDEFPEELRDTATSLALEGATAGIEDAAAEFLTQLEPLWDELQSGERDAVLAEWSRWCEHWGQWLVVRTPAGTVKGIAQRLDANGGLVLRASSGAETTVLAGDVSVSAAGCDAV